VNLDFFEGLGLYHGDGGERNFTSKTPELIERIICWVRKYKLAPSIHAYIIYSAGHDTRRMRNLLERYQIPYRVYEYPHFTAQVMLQFPRRLSIPSVKPTTSEEIAAYLRGTFAADGYVKHSTKYQYQTLESLKISFNQNSEKQRAIKISQYLARLQIKSRISITKHEGKIIITGYNNFIRFLKYDLIAFPRYKRRKFIRLLRNAKMHSSVYISERREIFKGNQRKLARKIGCSQSSVSLWKSGKCGIKISHLEKIVPLENVTIERLFIRTEEIEKSLIPIILSTW